MKKINLIQKLTKQLFLAGLITLASVSIADAQRGGRGGFGGRSSGGSRSFGGGGRSFGGNQNFRGNAHFNTIPHRGGFGSGNRIAAGPRYAPGRTYGGIRGGLNLSLNYRSGYRYGRPYPYYRGGFYNGYGAYHRGYFPHIGFYINTLPYGYYPFSYGGYPYYYNEGLFYQQYNTGYQVVAPPVGAEVPRLPKGAQDITIDGKQYFEKDGVYYLPIINQDGKKVYQVAGKDGVLNTDDGQQSVDPQYNDPQTGDQYPQQYNSNLPRVGDVVNAIPADSRKVKINGENLFVSPDGVYYQEDNSGNTRLFKVVGIPSEDGSTDTIAP
ncbi:MAG: hypothetical protein EOP41_09815 [Sphingobacteriaceae bacterium]|nr:MAG: hypothetical protein EOP41_09815 [Sphingobacteriaceae bacterium]